VLRYGLTCDCADLLGARQDVLHRRAVHLGQLLPQRAALGIGVDVREGEGAERLRHLWRRPVWVLVGVELHYVPGVAPEPL
jgi:hypothetical protein